MPKLHHSRPTLDQLEIQAVCEVIHSHHLAKGPLSAKFEAELCSHFGRKHAIFVSSGMAALHLSLHALGIKTHHQVILPSYVCSALLNAIQLCGASHELVDTPHQDFLIDPNLDALKNSAQAIIYPQLFGAQTSLQYSGKAHLIEDCAMSLGPCALKQGIVSITSFYATKMMTTGQGGALLTDDDGLAEQLRDLINYDNREDYKLRFNYAPTDISAALGLVQLKKLPNLLEQRHQLAQLYDQTFKQLCPEVLALKEGLGATYSNLFRYWIRVPDPPACISFLNRHQIEAKQPVFKPLHRYFNLSDQLFPHSSKAQDSFLSLPFYPQLGLSDVNRVAQTVLQFIKQR